MPGVAFSPKALQDLRDIGDYIARDSRANARSFVGKLQQQCQRIGRAPLAYPAREDLAPGLRMAALEHYVIFFRLTDGGIRIERVLHGARDLPGIFGSDPQG